MKVKIRSLIKITILTLFLVLIVYPYFTLEAAKLLDRKQWDKVEILYESYLSKPIRLQRDEALYRYSRNISGESGKYTIMMRGWGGGGNTVSLDQMDKAKKLLEEILFRYKTDGEYYNLAYSGILDISITLQQPEELLSWIDWGENHESKDINQISGLYMAYYHMVNRDFDLADKVLADIEEIHESKSKDVIGSGYYHLKSQIALFREDFDLAYEYLDKSRGYSVKYGQNILESNLRVDQYYLDEIYKIKGEYKIHGKVTYGGQPMPFTEVYFQKGDSIRSSGNNPVAITDINGEYETIGFKPGLYQAGIGLNASLLYDKVHLRKNMNGIDLQEDIVLDFTFDSPMEVLQPKPGTSISENGSFIAEWSSVSGADYYQVEIATIRREKYASSTFRRPITDKNGEYRIKDNRLVMDVKDLYDSFGGLAFSGEEMLLDPMGILGSVIPGDEHPIVINAYDKDENLIGSSLPIVSHYKDFPSIKVQRNISEGEKLIQEGRYTEAIEYYENRLLSDKYDNEALIYLSKIYMIGWKKGEQNIPKAIEYSMRYMDLTGDDYLAIYTIDFMDNKARRENKQFIEDMLAKVPYEKRDWSYYDNLGKLYISTEEYEKSREYLKMMDEYIPNDLLFLDLYLKDFDDAFETLKNDRLGFARVSRTDMIHHIENLKNSQIDDKDYKIFQEFLKMLLERGIDHEEGYNIYISTYEKISNPHIKNILNELKEENYWTEPYDEEPIPLPVE